MLLRYPFFLLLHLLWIADLSTTTAQTGSTIQIGPIEQTCSCLEAQLDVNAAPNARVARLTEFWRVVDTSRIVLIGELDHRDGSTLALKNDLIEHFTARYDSTVFIFESGMATIAEVDYRVRHQHDSIYKHLGYLSTPRAGAITRAYDSLAVKLQRVYDTHPGTFVFAGLDVLETVGYLELLLERIIPDTFVLHLNSKRTLTKRAAIESLVRPWQYHPFEDAAAERAHYARLDTARNGRIVDSLLRQLVIPTHEYAVLQSVRNNETLQLEWIDRKPGAEYAAANTIAKRDSLLAANAAYYIDKYPNHKVLISVSNFHAAKILPPYRETSGRNLRAAGSYLAERYGSSLVSFATLRYTGASGAWRYDSRDYRYRRVMKKKRSSLEYLLAEQCQSLGFLIFSNQLAQQRFRMHATFSESPNFEWSRAFDGVFFIHTMQTDVGMHYPHRFGIDFPD